MFDFWVYGRLIVDLGGRDACRASEKRAHAELREPRPPEIQDPMRIAEFRDCVLDFFSVERGATAETDCATVSPL